MGSVLGRGLMIVFRDPSVKISGWIVGHAGSYGRWFSYEKYLTTTLYQVISDGEVRMFGTSTKEMRTMGDRSHFTGSWRWEI